MSSKTHSHLAPAKTSPHRHTGFPVHSEPPLDPSIKTATFEELSSHYPRGSRSDLLDDINADQSMRGILAGARDDSALRLCHAFNLSGHPMPSASSLSPLAADYHNMLTGNHYIVSTADLAALLSKKLGAPRHARSQTDLLGRRGVLQFAGVPALGGASALALWDGQQLAESTIDWFSGAKELFFWAL